MAMTKVQSGYGPEQRRWSRLAVAAAIIGVYCVCAARAAVADVNVYQGDYGSVTVDGFAEQETDIHTAGQRNPYIENLGNPWANLFLEWGLADTTWRTPIAGLKFYSRNRLFVNNTYNVDATNYRHYDAFPQRFPGDGLAFMQAANDQVSFQGWEEWGQYEKGNWFLRVGKQTIVWGDVSPTRLLDEVNPLDLTWHLVNEPLSRDAYDNLRIPIWAVRAAYTLPFLPNFSIEGYVSPDRFAYVPTQLSTPQFPGAPYQLFSVPPPLQYMDNVNSGRHGISAGARLVGMLGGVNFSLVWIERHDPDPITQLTGIKFIPHTFIPSVIEISGQHPRFDSFGGSFNYFNDYTGVVVRGEAVYDNHRPWQNLSNPGDLLYRDRYGYVIAFDRPTFLVPWAHHSASLTLQYEQLWFPGPGHVAIGNAKVPRHEDTMTFLFEQPVEGFDWRGWDGIYDEWYLDVSTVQMIQQATVIQPMVRYEPGDHWRFASWYTLFIGPQNVPPFDATIGGFGDLTWADGLCFSVSYLF